MPASFPRSHVEGRQRMSDMENISSSQEVYALVDPSRVLSRERLKQRNNCRVGEDYRRQNTLNSLNERSKNT